ncbi:UDP-2,3-diacylglucosamine hydrolase [Mucilaginibacter sp. PAMC 26640]|nr:UDP-2,3-diacylglucosamine hydrolase [Mucilaginibacter sp. PAMC 26640]
MPTGKNIYFASDFHLGAVSHTSSREREDRIVRWLDMIMPDAAELFLVGDIFDFWFEYATVVPKGYIRFLGRLAQMADNGTKIYFFKGNHDMWMFDYLVTELNARIISDEMVMERGGKKFFLHHGDGLGPGDKKYKLLKNIFRSKLCQWLFARIHPNLGVGIANRWSRASRMEGGRTQHLRKHENEWLVTYSRQLLSKTHYDYLIFGHRHFPLDRILSPTSRYINLGEWVNFSTYTVFDGTTLELKHFEPAR